LRKKLFQVVKKGSLNSLQLFLLCECDCAKHPDQFAVSYRGQGSI